jgi:hypothetical protein
MYLALLDYVTWRRLCRRRPRRRRSCLVPPPTAGLSRQSGTDEQWTAGAAHPYVVFHEEEDVHEEWALPDGQIVYRCESAGEHRRNVTRAMLPKLS